MERMTRNRWLYRLLIIFIFVLSNIMCIVVSYNWAFMEYRGFCAPAYTALFSGIPYFIALIGCIIGVVVLHKNLKK